MTCNLRPPVMSKKGIVDDGLALKSAKTRLEFYFDEFEEAQAAVINDMQQGVSIKICGPRTREGTCSKPATAAAHHV